MNLLITGAYKWKQEHLEQLQNMGWNIFYSEREDEPLQCDITEMDAVVCNWLFVNHDIRDFKKLKYIQLLSAGLDRVPLDYIQRKEIKLFNARGVYSIPIAEYTLCGILQLYKHSRELLQNQKSHTWNKIRTMQELFGKHACVIGAGSVGNEIAKKLSAFTDEVYGVDLYPTPNPFMKHVFCMDSLDDEIQKSDIVILTLPLTETTRGLFDEKRFSIMKDNSVLVNVARGGLVVEKALASALDHKLFGAVLDVFEAEPLAAESTLWEKENLIISPHNSFVSENNDLRMWTVIHTNLNTCIYMCADKGETRGE